MYVWTDEARTLMDEIREYLCGQEVIPGAPEGTQEKYNKIKRLLDEERKRQVKLMFM